MLRSVLRLRWILISYFLIGGGVAIAMGTLSLAWYSSGSVGPQTIAELMGAVERGLEPGQPLPISIENVELVLAMVYASGTILGAFFAGRASPHKSIVEPAIAAAMVVGSFLLAIYLTPMGKLLIGLTGGHLERAVSILAGVGIVAGLIGAVLGELVSFRSEGAGVLRQTGIAILIALGALWASLTIVGIVYANELAKQALANLGNPETREIVTFSVPRALAFVGVALAVAAGAAGLATQLAFQRRAVTAAALGPLVVFATAIAPLGASPWVASEHAIVASAAVSIVSAIVSAAAAYLVWLSLASRTR